MKKMLAVIVDKCIGCHSCEIACAVAHSESKTLQGAIAEEPLPKPRVYVEYVQGYSVALQCRHCDDAPCIAACPSGALSRSGDGEPVLFDSTRCIGCKMCIQACPFGMINLAPDGKSMLKCDLCVEPLARGEEPACVCACPTSALQFVVVEESNRPKRRKMAEKLIVAEEK